MYRSMNGTTTLTLGLVLIIDRAGKLTVIKLLIVDVVNILIDASKILFQNSFKSLKKITGFLIIKPSLEYSD